MGHLPVQVEQRAAVGNKSLKREHGTLIWAKKKAGHEAQPNF
jgi:hypothetical protein